MKGRPIGYRPPTCRESGHAVSTFDTIGERRPTDTLLAGCPACGQELWCRPYDGLQMYVYPEHIDRALEQLDAS